MNAQAMEARSVPITTRPACGKTLKTHGKRDIVHVEVLKPGLRLQYLRTQRMKLL
jgi:hypothetical protein